jgi:hypothetical protein
MASHAFVRHHILYIDMCCLSLANCIFIGSMFDDAAIMETCAPSPQKGEPIFNAQVCPWVPL